MSSTIDDIKQGFRTMLSKGSDHQTLLELLLSVELADLSTDDTGWVRWNICDRYALLRDATNQYKYQSEFHKWCETHCSPHRLHWVVSDGTQAITLIDGGFSDFWWDCYQFANAHASRTPENRNVRFESHRANAYAHLHLRMLERASEALAFMDEVLAEDEQWPNRDFATVTLDTQLVDYHYVQGDEESLTQVASSLQQKVVGWLGRQGSTTEQVDGGPLLGSWEQMNSNRSASAVYTGAHNAACALARVRQFRQAEQLFRITADDQPMITPYGIAMYLLSCWENRHNPDEIATMARDLGTTHHALERHAPELLNVVWGSGA